MFWAVSYLLFEDESAHWPLHELILWFEILNGSIFEKRMIDINESMFVQHIHPKVPLSNPCSWATHMEVYAIATYFQAPMYFCTDPNLVLEVHTAGSTTGLLLTSPEALRYPPLISLTMLRLWSYRIVSRMQLQQCCVCSHRSCSYIPPQLTGKIICHNELIQ